MRLLEIKEGLIQLEHDLYSLLKDDNIYPDINSEIFAKEVYMKLIKLNHNDFFEKEINSLVKYMDLESFNSWSNNVRDNFISLLQDIAMKVQSLKVLLEKVVANDERFENIYSIKLPKYEYFDDVAEFTKKMNFIFSAVLNGNKKAKLVGFDVGSEWYLIALEAISDFKVFTVFINQVYKYIEMKKLRETLMKELDGTFIDAEDEVKGKVLEAMDMVNDKLAEVCAKRVCSLTQQERDVEDITKLSRAIVDMSKLFKEGTEVKIDKQVTDTADDNSLPKMIKSEMFKMLLEETSKELLDIGDESNLEE